MATTLETQTQTQTQPLNKLLETHVYVDGRLVPKEEARLSVEKGLLSEASIQTKPSRSGWGDQV